MITLFDNKVTPGHLALVRNRDVVVAHLAHISNFDLKIDDFNTLPANSLVLVLLCGEVKQDNPDPHVLALITYNNTVSCCKIRKHSF